VTEDYPLPEGIEEFLEHPETGHRRTRPQRESDAADEWAVAGNKRQDRAEPLNETQSEYWRREYEGASDAYKEAMRRFTQLHDEVLHATFANSTPRELVDAMEMYMDRDDLQDLVKLVAKIPTD
jgi:hypothetical protein